ncbi:hypothetical protein HPB48_002534 [Haemaphysalis longicornis]|uniref:Uncharacterized protein n=1 Tax=Haemaphysalis longicornis TaxID=44386 RepID=A0A9J6GLU3_HAELO|nr:hypothetical protein HPB48_002534 [Haemaphysalis longicornis]
MFEGCQALPVHAENKAQGRGCVQIGRLTPNHYNLTLAAVKSSNDRGILRRDSSPPCDPSAGPNCAAKVEPVTNGYAYNGTKENPSTTAADVGAPGHPLASTEHGLASMAGPSALNATLADTYSGEGSLTEEPLHKLRHSSSDLANGNITSSDIGARLARRLGEDSTRRFRLSPRERWKFQF